MLESNFQLLLRPSGLSSERASFESQNFRASRASFEHAWTWSPSPIVETERSFERASELDTQNFWASRVSFEQNFARSQHYFQHFKESLFTSILCHEFPFTFYLIQFNNFSFDHPLWNAKSSLRSIHGNFCHDHHLFPTYYWNYS